MITWVKKSLGIWSRDIQLQFLPTDQLDLGRLIRNLIRMFGSESDRGLIPRLLNGLFENLKQFKENSNKTILTKVSYIEIYNENIIDLLTEQKGFMEILDCNKKGVKISNLTEVVVQNCEQI